MGRAGEGGVVVLEPGEQVPVVKRQLAQNTTATTTTITTRTPLGLEALHELDVGRPVLGVNGLHGAAVEDEVHGADDVPGEVEHVANVHQHAAVLAL